MSEKIKIIYNYLFPNNKLNNENISFMLDEIKNYIIEEKNENQKIQQKYDFALLREETLKLKVNELTEQNKLLIESNKNLRQEQNMKESMFIMYIFLIFLKRKYCFHQKK